MTGLFRTMTQDDLDRAIRAVLDCPDPLLPGIDHEAIREAIAASNRDDDAALRTYDYCLLRAVRGRAW